MLEERESLTAEYERENEQLRAELAQMKHQQGEVDFWVVTALVSGMFPDENILI